MNAYEAILEALIARQRTGEGAELSVAMFDAMADWMAVPLIAAGSGQAAAARRARPYRHRAVRRVPQPRRRGHSHFRAERPRMAGTGGESAGRCRCSPPIRTSPPTSPGSSAVPRRIAKSPPFSARSTPSACGKSWPKPISPSRTSTTMAALARHPHLRRITVGTASGPVSYPAPAAKRGSASEPYGAVPALGEHTAKVRAEFTAACLKAE